MDSLRCLTQYKDPFFHNESFSNFHFLCERFKLYYSFILVQKIHVNIIKIDTYDAIPGLLNNVKYTLHE